MQNTRWVPCGHDDAPVIRVSFYLVYDVLQLVYSVATVVSMHILVLSSKMTPLEPIYWSQVSCKKQ